ncbi:MAG: DOMON-like domain-containing protein [Chromatiales bacterium]|nr:DOMON-like domain-containing protein [Chromatiales bacterium]
MQLQPHPESAAGPVRQVEATAAYGPDGALQLTWRLVADLARLRVPPATTPARADELWQHTCFEAFVADPHSAGYLELNFSPSGEWAAYGFRSYRTGMAPLPLRNDPRARWQRMGDELTLLVDFRMDDLPGPPGPRPPIPLRVALAAVIEDDAGTLGYWALHHPEGKPDFHHAESFVLQVDP